MALPPHSTYPLAPDMPICRLLNGMWQVSGAHGRIDPQIALQEMLIYHNAGYTTWDLADHYGPPRILLAHFAGICVIHGARRPWSRCKHLPNGCRALAAMSRQVVEENINISLRRMAVDTLDLLQFHWWEYGDSRYLEALSHMADLRDEGKIRHLALTNFDTENVQRILDQGIRIVSNQVQYSLIDLRPERAMVPLCEAQGMSLLTYGTLGGGLISDAYLGRPDRSRGAAS